MISQKRITVADCFDEGAAFVLGAAKAEIFRRNQQVIDVGHIILGTLVYERRSASPLIALDVLGGKRNGIVRTLDLSLGHGPDILNLSRPNRLSDAALSGISWALELARRGGLDRVRYYHLFLGMIETEVEISQCVLNLAQTNVEAFRKRVAAIDGSESEALIPKSSDVLFGVDLQVSSITIPVELTSFPGALGR